MEEYRVTGTRSASGAAALQARTLRVPLALGATAGAHLPEPIELLLAAIAADVLAGAHRAAQAMALEAFDIVVEVSALPRAGRDFALRYEVHVGTDEPEERLAQLHAGLRRLTPVVRAVAAALPVTGGVRRGVPAVP